MGRNLEKIGGIMLQDLKAYYLKPPNLVFGIMFPLVMIATFSLRGAKSIHEAAPGLLAMTIFFGASSMETALIAIGRRDLTIERVLMAPVGFPVFLTGKILGGAVFGLVMTVLLLPVAVWGFGLPVASPPLLAGAVLGGALAAAAFGALLAVVTRDSTNSMSLANLTRFPMVFLAGVFVPVRELPAALARLALFLPLTYAVDLVRHATTRAHTLLPWYGSLGMVVLYTAAMVVAASRCMQRWTS